MIVERLRGLMMMTRRRPSSGRLLTAQPQHSSSSAQIISEMTSRSLAKYARLLLPLLLLLLLPLPLPPRPPTRPNPTPTTPISIIINNLLPNPKRLTTFTLPQPNPPNPPSPPHPPNPHNPHPQRQPPNHPRRLTQALDNRPKHHHRRLQLYQVIMMTRPGGRRKSTRNDLGKHGSRLPRSGGCGSLAR